MTHFTRDDAEKIHTSDVPGIEYAIVGKVVRALHIGSGLPIAAGAYVPKGLRAFYKKSDAILAKVDWDRAEEVIVNDKRVKATVEKWKSVFIFGRR